MRLRSSRQRNDFDSLYYMVISAIRDQVIKGSSLKAEGAGESRVGSPALAEEIAESKSRTMTDENTDGHGKSKRKIARITEDKAKKKRRKENQGRQSPESAPRSGRVVPREKVSSNERNLPSRRTKAREQGNSIRDRPLSPNPNHDISSGGLYQLAIDKNALLSEYPACLAYIRTVQVAEKTRSHVVVKFPSASSLRTYFGRDPLANAADEVEPGLKAVSAKSTAKRSKGGTKSSKDSPELDEKFTMTPKVAEKILVRAVSQTEYGQRAHHWSFWVIEDTKNQGDNFVSDGSRSGSLEVNHEAIEPFPPDSPREMGAVEALMLLMPDVPQNSNNSADGSQTAREESAPCEHRNNGLSTRSPIKWGMRSLRKPNSGARDRHSEKNSPASATASGADRRDSRRVDASCRKSLDYSEPQRPVQARRTPESKKAKESKAIDYSEQQRKVHVRRTPESKNGKESKEVDYSEPQRPVHARTTPESKNAKESKEVKLRKVPALAQEANTVKQSNNEKQNASSKQNRSNNILKLPKDMRGRWASERYTSAQLKLIDIMHQRGAVPGKPILRPVLREEARKDIGDTGLLDHLLKHMTDTVVTNGERFRRRHNAAGAMEYWLEDANYLDMRIAAGIDDPFWIPPPGWKPGDSLSSTGGYNLHVNMTPAEAAEMTDLKTSVDKLNAQLSSLLSIVKKTWSPTAFADSVSVEDVGPTDHERQPQKECSCVQAKLNNQVEDGEDVLSRITSEINCIREQLLKVSENRSPRRKDARHAKELKSKSNDKLNRDKMCQPTLPEDWIGSIHARLQNIDIEVQKLSEDGRNTQPSVTATKNQLEADLKGLRHTVNRMEEDVMDVARRLGLPAFISRAPQSGPATEIATSQGRILVPADSITNPTPTIPDASQVTHIRSEQQSVNDESFPYFRRNIPAPHHQSEDLLNFIHQSQNVSCDSSGPQYQSAYPGSYAVYDIRKTVDTIPDQFPASSRARSGEDMSSLIPPDQLQRPIVQSPKTFTSSFSPALFGSRAAPPPCATTAPPPKVRASFNGLLNFREDPSRFGGIPSIISARREKTGGGAHLFFRQSKEIHLDGTSDNGQSADPDIGIRAPGLTAVRPAVGTPGVDCALRPFRPVATRAVQNDGRGELFRYGSSSTSQFQGDSKWVPSTVSFDEMEPHHILNALREEQEARLPPQSLAVESSVSQLFNVMEDVLSPRVPTTPSREVSFGDTPVKFAYQGRTPPFQLYDVLGSQKRGQNSSFCPDDPLEQTRDVTEYNIICEPAAGGRIPSNGTQSYPGCTGKGIAEMYFSNSRCSDNHSGHRTLEQQSNRQQNPPVGSKKSYYGPSDTTMSSEKKCWLGLGLPTTE